MRQCQSSQKRSGTPRGALAEDVILLVRFEDDSVPHRVAEPVHHRARHPRARARAAQHRGKRARREGRCTTRAKIQVDDFDHVTRSPYPRRPRPLPFQTRARFKHLRECVHERVQRQRLERERARREHVRAERRERAGHRAGSPKPTQREYQKHPRPRKHRRGEQRHRFAYGAALDPEPSRAYRLRDHQRVDREREHDRDERRSSVQHEPQYFSRICSAFIAAFVAEPNGRERDPRGDVAGVVHRRDVQKRLRGRDDDLLAPGYRPVIRAHVRTRAGDATRRRVNRVFGFGIFGIFGAEPSSGRLGVDACHLPIRVAPAHGHHRDARRDARVPFTDPRVVDVAMGASRGRRRRRGRVGMRRRQRYERGVQR